MRNNLERSDHRRRPKPRFRRAYGVLVPVLAFGLVAAACGGGSDDDADDTTPVSTDAPVDTDAPAATDAPQSTEVADSTATTEASESTEVDDTTPAIPEDLDPAGVMRVGTPLVFPSGIHLDPTKSAVNADRLWMHLAFGTLLRWTEDGSIEPFMAESYEIVDPQTVSITLPDGVTFTDGTPYDAEAVKAGLLRTLNEASEVTAASQSVAFKSISDVAVVDPLNLTITLTEPQAGELVVALADREGAIVAPSQVAAAPDDIDVQPIGAGPYVVDEFIDGQSVVLSKNPDFHDPDSWLLGGVEFIGVADGASIVNGLQSDVLDIATGVPNIDASRLSGDDAFTVQPNANDRSYTMLNLCTGKAPLDDADVRKAMQLAIDRDGLNELIYEGTGIPAYTLWPPNNVYYNPDVEELISYDPEQATELLGGETVDVDLAFVSAVPGHDVITEVLQSQLDAVGFNVTIIPTQDPVAEWITPQSPGALLVPGSRSGVDKYNRVFQEGQVQTLCGAARPEVVDAVAPAAAMAPGDPDAAAAFQEADMLIAEGGYVIPLMWTPNIAAWNSDKLGGEQQFSGESSTIMFDTFYVKQ